MPLPGRLGTYFVNFYQEYYGDREAPYKDWNLPVYDQFYETFYGKDSHQLDYFTYILSNMTGNIGLNVSTIDLPAILSPVPDYKSRRR